MTKSSKLNAVAIAKSTELISRLNKINDSSSNLYKAPPLNAPLVPPDGSLEEIMLDIYEKLGSIADEFSKSFDEYNKLV